MRFFQTLTGLALVAAAHQAGAATFNLTDTVTYSGSGAVVTTGVGSNGPITPTVSFGLSNAFNGAPIAADFPGTVAPGTGGPWNFYDDYIFTVGPSGSNVQSALISFNSAFVGITHLQGRIIGVNGTFDPTANLGAPASGNTIIDRWVNTSPVAGINTVDLSQTTFGPGTYDLQIRGQVLGAPPSGGYGGSISFTTVPLPAALPLLLGGLGLLAGSKRRRRETATGERQQGCQA